MSDCSHAGLAWAMRSDDGAKSDKEVGDRSKSKECQAAGQGHDGAASIMGDAATCHDSASGFHSRIWLGSPPRSGPSTVSAAATACYDLMGSQAGCGWQYDRWRRRRYAALWFAGWLMRRFALLRLGAVKMLVVVRNEERRRRRSPAETLHCASRSDHGSDLPSGALGPMKPHSSDRPGPVSGASSHPPTPCDS